MKPSGETLALAAFVVRRALWMVPVLLGVTFVTFSLTWVATDGDLSQGYITEKMSDSAAEQLRRNKGFDQPFHVQYLAYLQRLASGDLGHTRSAGYGERPIVEVLAERFPATLELAIFAMAFAIVVALPLGAWSAARQGKAVDHGTRLLALLSASLPAFWLALLLKIAFATPIGLPILPLGGRYSTTLALTHPVLLKPGPTGLLTVDTLLAGDLVAFGDVALHLVLPALTLGLGIMAILSRILRSAMLESLRQDYVRTAAAKGVRDHDVVHVHARATAMLPFVTIVGLALGALLGGAVLTETIFQWPGLGDWAARGVRALDPHVVLSFTLVAAVLYLATNLVVDVIYALRDPRVRLA